MKLDYTGIILAGGTNKRLPGKKKIFHKINGVSMLERLCEIFNNVFKETILVVKDPKEFSSFNMTIVTDIIPLQCSLAGIHTGLFYSSFPYSFISACDMPFLEERTIRYIISNAKHEYQVVIPATKDGLEPLAAVYSKKCLLLIEEKLKKNIFRIQKSFKKDKMKIIPVKEFEKLDLNMNFAFNINTRQDLELAKKIKANYNILRSTNG